ncbi:PTS system mannose/fructose/sorbose family transporter subunit IID [Erysipelothrix sp. HDW6C]|uniref:PTS system mannose/fructose/sorbose family transporter subunit IID n=1 Tax=Erysipelothrix sp. HDW6C TaxID=2714930 RepID=UPI001407B875|nr:PTS system mannose/fructose/sorbose family transporter subunit IID [Erysipelothrix sp. HDW6C]QIK69246.1 PTS system mannose/fructose/sorbose family transporter subunit IID [Erysipelothrix sp. HDW6C]
MESNVTHYKDLTPAKPLDKKTLNKMVWRSLFLQASFNYERMQAAGWLYGILPGLEKIHTNKEDLAASMGHNLEFFNTHPFLVTFVMGIVLNLEQQKADIPTIRAVRVAAMGPLGGIGDALFWMTLVPITAGITANMAINEQIMGPILFLVIFNVVQFVLRFWLMNMSYKLGASAIDVFTKNAKEFTRAAGILGVFIVGAMTSIFGGTAIRISFVNGSLVTNIQQTLDGILPKLVPLALTLLMYFLLKKRNWSPTKCIVLLLVIGIFGTATGILAGDSKATNPETGEAIPGGYNPLLKWYDYATEAPKAE